MLEQIVPAVIKLGTIRKIPQFLYVDQIQPSAMVAVRAQVIEFKKRNPTIREIDFVLSSPGGSPDVAYRIIRTLRKNFEIVNVVVPFWAKSAATLLSLGASKIIMDEFGEFGPLDMQLAKERDDSPEYGMESALNDEQSLIRLETRFKEFYETLFLRLYGHSNIRINKLELSKQLLESVTKFYAPLLEQIDPYRLGEKKRKLDIGLQYARRILVQFNPSVPWEKVVTVADYLVNGCPDHGYVIDYDMMVVLLPQLVIPSERISPQYQAALSEVAELFIQNRDDDTWVGFVDVSMLEPAEDDLADTPIADDADSIPEKDISEEDVASDAKSPIIVNGRTKPTAKPLDKKKSLANIAPPSNGQTHENLKDEWQIGRNAPL